MAKRRREVARNVAAQLPAVHTVVMDLGFDNVMQPREIASLVQQLVFCHGANRRATRPFRLVLAELGGRTRERLQQSVPSHVHWTNVEMDPRPYLEMFPREKLVYLTAESPNTLTTLDSEKVYIIGGLVDHNRLKGTCFAKAQAQGIATAKLPLEQFVQMESRKVLAVNHVYDILLAFAQSNNWESSLVEHIPQRKAPTPVSGGSASGCPSADSSS